MAIVHFCGAAASLCLILFGAGQAAAECHLKARTVVMCQDPKNAAAAYQEFGFNETRMKTSYNLQLLQESWCATVSESTAQPRKLELFSSGRIATSSGWVDVMQIGFKHDGINDVRYVAAGYVSGQCRRYKYDPTQQLIDPAARRSPNLPSIPPDGYKIPENAGAMP
jgi:hypothetical protein